MPATGSSTSSSRTSVSTVFCRRCWPGRSRSRPRRRSRKRRPRRPRPSPSSSPSSSRCGCRADRGCVPLVRAVVRGRRSSFRSVRGPRSSVRLSARGARLSRVLGHRSLGHRSRAARCLAAALPRPRRGLGRGTSMVGVATAAATVLALVGRSPGHRAHGAGASVGSGLAIGSARRWGSGLRLGRLAAGASAAGAACGSATAGVLGAATGSVDGRTRPARPAPSAAAPGGGLRPARAGRRDARRRRRGPGGRAPSTVDSGAVPSPFMLVAAVSGSESWGAGPPAWRSLIAAMRSPLRIFAVSAMFNSPASWRSSASTIARQAPLAGAAGADEIGLAHEGPS